MATEDIRIEDGRILVDRAGTKPNVDVATSDVDSVTFTRSGGDGQADGALVLHTDNGDVVIRVANDDAGKALTLLRDNKVGNKESEQEIGAALEDGKPVGAPANENENAPIEQPESPSGRAKKTTK